MRDPSNSKLKFSIFITTTTTKNNKSSLPTNTVFARKKHTPGSSITSQAAKKPRNHQTQGPITTLVPASTRKTSQFPFPRHTHKLAIYPDHRWLCAPQHHTNIVQFPSSSLHKFATCAYTAILPLNPILDHTL